MRSETPLHPPRATGCHQNMKRHGQPSREGGKENPCGARGGRLGRRRPLCGCGTGETRARLRALSLLDLDNGAPLMRWSLMCQHPVFRSVESRCVIPVHGKGVTVEDEDGTNIPAEPLAFNSAGQSDPVDRGLPSATSSLRVRARTHSSYSRFQLHVNGGTSSSDLDIGFEHVDRVRHGA